MNIFHVFADCLWAVLLQSSYEDILNFKTITKRLAITNIDNLTCKIKILPRNF